MTGFAFDCPSCGERHIGLPAVAYDEPALGFDDGGQPWQLSRNGKDFCIADGRHFFIRTVLRVPILGASDPMEWGVWCSLSEANFKRYWDTFDDMNQAEIGPMFSYLGNNIAGYSGSLSLRCNVLPQNEGKRPLVELHPDQDHPLVRDQAQGISPERAVELVMPALHPQGNA